MEEFKEANIEITTFVNPHLFWFILKTDERRKVLATLNKEMKECADSTINVKNQPIYEIGEIVAAKIDNKFYRATIEDIFEIASKNLYLLWLIDYGTMRESEFIYKLSRTSRKTNALSFQASLNNIVYSEQCLEIDSNGVLTTNKKHIIHPPASCRQESMRLFSNCHDFKFIFERTEDGIIFGDVLFKDKHGNENSLRNCLLKTGRMDVNEALFDDIIDFISNYRENHLMVITKICNKDPYPLEAIEDAVNVSCMTIVSKILEEFQYSELLSYEDEVSEPLWRFNKSKNSTVTSLDNTISDSDTSTKNKSKKSQLMEKLWQHKNSQGTSTNSNDDSTIKNQAVSPELKISTSKIKKMCEKMKQHKLLKGQLVADETKRSSQIIKGRNIIFSPSGSERTCSKSYEYSKALDKKEDDARNSRNFETKSSSIKTKSSSIKTKFNSIETKTADEENDGRKTTSNDDDAKWSTDAKSSSDSKSSWDAKSSSDVNDCHDRNFVPTMKIKPHCNCKQCKAWTKEENVFVETLGDHQKAAKIDVAKPHLLFKYNEVSVREVEICSVDYSSMNKVEKQAIQKVLVHSEIISNPINQISKVAFHKDIHSNLHRLDYRDARRIQSYVWPAILRNQHVFMIHGPQTGKTIAYLPVMLTFILEKHDRYDSLMKIAGGPIVIVLCATTFKCEEVYDLAKVLLRNIRAHISLVTYPIIHTNTSHTDMLITTPSILIDLLRNKNVNFKRLCHLIIEDGDTVLTKYRESMMSVFEMAQSMLMNRVFTKSLQMIVCAEHWNSYMKCLSRRLSQVPMICIGNYLEAALYGQVEFSMKFVDSACKEQELKNILKDSHRVYKSVVVCKEEEVEEIHQILSLKGIDNVVATSSMAQEDIVYIEDIWAAAKGGNYTVLVCSDFVLHTCLSITSATVLIHYSLPKSWTKFIKRFSCLLENCKSPLDIKEHKILSKSIVLCDESCKDQLYRFFNYINSTELKKQLPEKLKEFSESLKQSEEEMKLEKGVGLCERLKLHGKCENNQCPRRHVINPSTDISDYLPKSGEVKFKIVGIVDVVTYSIQLLQHVDSDNKVHEFDEILDLSEELTATLRLSRKKIHNPVLGHRYAFYNVDEQDGYYDRCELIDIDDDCVKIKLVDKGTIISTLSSRLYRLPKEFDSDNKPRAVIDAYLADLVPPYQDENFSAKSFFNLKTLLESHDYKNVIFTGEIHLQLDNTLWLKDVYQEVVLSDKIIPGFQLCREMLQKKLVENKFDQLLGLYELCVEAGVSLPKYGRVPVATVDEYKEVLKRWAFLDKDQVNEVTFAAAFSPDEMFVRLNKFSDLLYNLQKEIQKSLQKPHYPKLNDINIGDVCLAKDPEGNEYCRVIIMRQEYDSALCFYADFGDEVVVAISDLKFIQDQFVTALPFQCIQCRLYGIKPVGEFWDENVTNSLYNYAHEPSTDIFRTLYVKVCEKEQTDSITPAKYSVLIKDGFGDKKILINRLLIECGMVIANTEESFDDFEIPVVRLESDESESDNDVKRIEYICKQTEEIDRIMEENGDANVNRQSHDNIEPNLEEMELFIYGEASDFFTELVGGKDEISDVKKTNYLPAITAAPPVDYYTPDVYWSQTDSSVKLSIRVSGVEDYKLTLTKRRIFNFRSTSNEKTYLLKLMLYNYIDSVQHTLSGHEIRVTMIKSTIVDWPRLILSKQKARNIRYDTTKISIDEDDNKKILQLPKELDYEDSGSDDDEDLMYTVHSDLDSDMDVELNHDSDS